MGLDDDDGRDWTRLKKGSKYNSKETTVPNYEKISNRYATLPCFSAPPDPIHQPTPNNPPQASHQNHHRLKIERRRKAKLALQIKRLCENEFFHEQITCSEDESTSLAKCNKTNVQRVMIDTAHSSSPPTSLTFLQRGVNAGYNLSTKFCRAIRKLKNNNQPRVRFASDPDIVTFRKEE